MTPFPNSKCSEPVALFGIFGMYDQSCAGHKGRQGAGEDKNGKEEEQSEYEFPVQKSTLDLIISKENRYRIFHIT